MFQVHKFGPSAVDATKCVICRRTEENHHCEVCNNVGSVGLMYGTILMCPACAETEEKKIAEIMRPENVAARLAEVENKNKVLEAAREIDSSIQVRTDLFNAATVSIVELKKAIDSDDTITNKPYTLAERLTERFNHFKQVIFEMNEKIVQAGNEQKAIQVYLNQLANSLRQEEREKLKIADINYKPKTVKPVKPATIKTAAKSGRLNKEELRKYAAELGVAEFTLQMLVVSKGITVEQAANMLRKSINEAKSEVQ